MAKPNGASKRQTNSRLKTKKTAAQRLMEDHKKLKALFAEFEKSKDPKRKKEIFESTEEELRFDLTSEKEFLSPMPRMGSVDADLRGERIPFTDEIMGERL